MIAKLFGIVLVELALYVLLRQYKPELAPLSEVAAAALVLFTIGGELSQVKDFFTGALSNAAEDVGGIGILMKTLGTALIAQLAADTARDSGQSALAEKIEFGGKVLILAFALPLLKALLQLINTFSENIT